MFLYDPRNFRRLFDDNTYTRVIGAEHLAYRDNMRCSFPLPRGNEAVQKTKADTTVAGVETRRASYSFFTRTTTVLSTTAHAAPR